MSTRPVRRLGPIPLAIVVAFLLTAAQPSGTVICHREGPLEDPFGENSRTMVVHGSAALAAHLRHGDTLGPCPGQPPPKPSPTRTPTPRPSPTVRPTPTIRPTPKPTMTGTPRPTSNPRPTPTLPPGVTPTTPPTDTE